MELQAREEKAVVVVEDDDYLRDGVLVPGLRQFGFEPVGVKNALEFYQLLVVRRDSLYVIDLGLPDQDGLALMRSIRQGSDAGIVLLTGRSSASDKVEGFREGADVYLVKPVEIEVLAASLHSLMRRLRPAEGSPQAAVDRAALPWTIEANGWRMVCPNGAVVALSGLERMIVQKLAVSNGRPVAKDLLIDAICEHVEDFDPARIETVIHRLRKKVVKRCGTELPLLTVRGVGLSLRVEQAG